MKLIKNARVVTPTGIIDNGRILIRNGVIEEVGDETKVRQPQECEVIDASGLYAGPGFVDIHCHNGAGHIGYKEPTAMAGYHLKHGTTSLLCTIYRSVGFEGTIEGIKAVKEECLAKNSGNLVGVHLEGPYLNPRFGAISVPYKEPEPAEYNSYIETADGLLKQWTFSPELNGLDGFVEAAGRAGISLAIGHSAAGQEHIDRYIGKGVKIVTHLMDATGYSLEQTRYLGTREPSFDECAMIHDLYTEVIPDYGGIHVRPVMLKLILKTMGVDRVVIVTDCYDEEEKPSSERDDDVNLKDGILCGSKLTMDLACYNMKLHTGCSISDIFKMGAKNPAEAIGINDSVGTIESGKKANIVLVDEEFKVYKVFLEGNIKFEL
jgi:N-acetylglucosamine-6-phosphate deacetylase